jgi:flagellar hook-associated protein 1
MSTLSALEIGKRALIAQQFGIDVTGNNISNVNTTGYSRRQVVLGETDPNSTTNGYYGTGVIAEQLRNFRDSFFDSEIRKNISQNSTYTSDETILRNIQAILSEPSDNGLNEIVSKFFNTFESLASNPENISLRDNVIQLAKTMVERFHTTAQQFADTRKGILSDMSANVVKANDLIKKIADLNKQIANSKAQNGSDPQVLIDQRAGALEDLSKIAGIAVTQNADGSDNVYINGTNIITGSTSSRLSISEIVNSATGERSAVIQKLDPNGNPIENISVQSGELSSQLKNYNVTLDDKDSSDGFSIARQLDDFASAIVQKVNNLTTQGYGLNDTGTSPSGRSFFTPAIGNATASTIEISQDILNNPANLPLSDAANAPGNNNIARSIALLSSDTEFLNGMTPTEFYSGFLGKIGTMSSEAVTGKTTTGLVSDQLSSQRSSVIGVNLNEEAVNLIKFQKAFEASSRIINVTNELLTTIINLGR